jgi:uncharacterized damage-inducible protein DinB
MTAPTPELAALFLDFSRRKLMEQYWPRLRECVNSLNDDQVWWRPNSASNAIGNLLLHLNGNVGQWIVATFNRLEDKRDRPHEFDEQQQPSGAELLRRLGSTLDQAAEVLTRLTALDLHTSYTIQGYNVRGMEAIYHVVEHFCLHYGQIVYITKMLTAKDMGFYKELGATGRTEPTAGESKTP